MKFVAKLSMASRRNQEPQDCVIANVLAQVKLRNRAVNDRDDGKHRRHCIAELIDHSYGRRSWKKQGKQQVWMVAELKDAIQAGIKIGPGVPAEEVFDRLKHKYAAMKKGSHG